MERREFIGKLAVSAPVIAGATALTDFAPKQMFIHHVYFWLKDPGNKKDEEKLIEGLRKLTKIKTIKTFHIGKPAPTNRDVIDRSYAISWLAVFDDQAGEESYQTDPIHLKFVEDCSSVWTKVIVYDSIDV